MAVNTKARFYKWEVVLLLWVAFFLNQADRQAFNIVLMGVSGTFVTVCAALSGFGFFRAFFDAGTFAVLYDVIEPKYYSTSSAVLILFGFGIGALAPWILGIISDHIGLSAGIASLGAVWVVGSIALLIARVLFFDKDAERIKK